MTANTLAAVPCAFEPQGEGRVSAVIDARSVRMEDGREVRLIGIEPAFSEKPDLAPTQALTAMLIGHDVRLTGRDDTPDRYGRQLAFVWRLPDDTLVQRELLFQGLALVSPTVDDKECAAALMAAEGTARDAKRGIWADPTVIKNTESPGDILAGNGRFMLVEGKVLSARQSGAITYLNFGRSWTRDFAVTIPKQALANLAAAGLVPKSLENKRIRVRGFVEARTGPRIEVLRAGQIEILGGK
ncbi:thermonuclease family protein [Bradyrhizobium sp.]|uniref:thermonuclease family protein n=1 Tax=Bradyrhizobium sp. TaxID=376 RepID=UPI00261B1D4A|nr:thermonuclease family protein [Bradyrhizobium sp.]